MGVALATSNPTQIYTTLTDVTRAQASPAFRGAGNPEARSQVTVETPIRLPRCLVQHDRDFRSATVERLGS